MFSPFSSNAFHYTPFVQSGINSFQNYNNPYINYSFNNSLENTQESGSISNISTSEDKNSNNHYYDNYGDNYYDSLEKGIKDISRIYNNNKRNRPKVSLLCNYYCNLDRTPEEENYIIHEIQTLSDNLKKMMGTNTNENEKNEGNKNIIVKSLKGEEEEKENQNIK